MLALYLNVFVGVVQAFQKRSFQQRLAPTQSEPPFLAAQLTVLASFVGTVAGLELVPRILDAGRLRGGRSGPRASPRARS